jgi:hypothetical protein
MPEIYDPKRDQIVNTKKHYDRFLGSDLAMTLHAMNQKRAFVERAVSDRLEWGQLKGFRSD